MNVAQKSDAKPSRSWGYGASKEYLQRVVTERAATFPLYAARAQEVLGFLAWQERARAEWDQFRPAPREAAWTLEDLMARNIAKLTTRYAERGLPVKEAL